MSTHAGCADGDPWRNGPAAVAAVSVPDDAGGRRGYDMATSPQPTRTSGWVTFASWMLLLAGLWQGFLGFLGVLSGEFYVVGQRWVAQLDVTTWGWIHMALGLLLFVTGIFVQLGRSWATWVGIVLAGVSAFAMFAWAPYFPVWAITVIAVDVLVIYGLAAHGGEVGTERASGIPGM